MLPRAWRYKRFHSSSLLMWCALGVLAGLALGRIVTVPHELAWVLVIGLFVGISFKSRRWYACVVLVAAGFLLGAMRASSYAQELQVLAQYQGSTVAMSGVLQQDPVLTTVGSAVWQAELSGITIRNTPVAGSVYATIVSDTVLKRGDTVQLTGKLAPGFGSFQASLYRARLDTVAHSEDPFLAARDSFSEAVRTVMPEPEASLGVGFVVGQKSALPGDFADQLKTVGLTHVVVASGYNLTILVRFARRLLARRSRYLALAGSLALVLSFVFVSGFSASMNRAAVVTLLSLLAWYYGRKFHPVQLILYVAAASAVVNPQYVWGDLGWLLSFAAFTGILVIAPLVTKLVRGDKKEPGPVVRLVVETLAAEIMTLPIIIVAFGYIPVLALLANVLVAPVIPAAMLLTFVAGVVGWVAPVLGVLAYPASIVIAYVVAIIEKLSSIPWARMPIVVTGSVAAAWYALLAGVAVIIHRRHKVDLLGKNVVE